MNSLWLEVCAGPAGRKKRCRPGDFFRFYLLLQREQIGLPMHLSLYRERQRWRERKRETCTLGVCRYRWGMMIDGLIDEREVR